MGFDLVRGGDQLKAAAEAQGRPLRDNSWGVDDQELVRAVKDSLPGKAPFFAVVYNTISHQPYTYEPNRREGSDFERYQAALRYGDDALRAVADELKARGQFDDTVFVMIGDHGDDFTNGRWKVRGCFLNEQSVTVPLVIALPGLHLPKLAVTGARQIDLAPTVLDLVGVAPEAALQGRSLFDGRTAATPAYLNSYGACDVAGIVEGPAKALYDAASGEAETFALDGVSEGPAAALAAGEAKSALVRRLEACAQYNENALRSLTK
jgi:phosphoglycerol transferase MdoB-like AlkP superfamily enzyme